MAQNVWLAFGLSVILIALAARGILNPLTGALSQSVAVFVVVVNSARILSFGNQKAVRRRPITRLWSGSQPKGEEASAGLPH
jgi:hypothetical protein